MNGEKSSAVINAAPDSTYIPRSFDTFAKRIAWCQRPGETDREFARRLGVSIPTIRRWKRREKVPERMWITEAEKLADRNSVSWVWLFVHIGYRMVTPDGSLLE
jgi:hypothetical protein